MKTINAVAFDMDGLMFNTEDVYWKTSEELLRRRGKVYTHDLFTQLLGLQPEPTFRTIIDYHKLDDDWESMHRESEELFLRFLQDGFEMMPGLESLLAFLELHKIPKCICTSSAPAAVDAVLGAYAMRPRFDFVLTAADIARGKPHPEIYATAAARWNIPPSQVLVLEDSVAGMESGLAAGCVVGVLRSQHNFTNDYRRAHIVVEKLDAPELLSLLSTRSVRTLSSLKSGESATITASSLLPEFVERLMGMGLFVGSRVTRLSDGVPVRIALGETRLAISSDLAEQIECEVAFTAPR
ncbi:MAG: HAD-IA family hydrolase [Thermoguttaceae bacterium]